MANSRIKKDYYKVFIIGVGGTGGAAASQIARFIYSKKEDNTKEFSLCLVDGDHVDEKNVNRQPFSSIDVGQFKVDCLQEAYTETYDINCISFAEFIDDLDRFYKMITSVETSYSNVYDINKHLIIIGAVDNHRARQTLNKFFNEYSNKTSDILYIDSANEFDFGTVVAGYKNKEGIIESPDRAFFFPGILNSKERKASEISCGEINISAPQHYATNMMAANIVFSQFVNFVENHGKYLDGVTYFHSFNCSVNNRPLQEYLADSYKEYNVKCYPDLVKKIEEENKNDNKGRELNRTKKD